MKLLLMSGECVKRHDLKCQGFKKQFKRVPYGENVMPLSQVGTQ